MIFFLSNRFSCTFECIIHLLYKMCDVFLCICVVFVVLFFFLFCLYHLFCLYAFFLLLVCQYLHNYFIIQSQWLHNSTGILYLSSSFIATSMLKCLVLKNFQAKVQLLKLDTAGNSIFKVNVNFYCHINFVN